MLTAPQGSVEVRPLQTAFAAEVDVDLDVLDDRSFAALIAAWRRHPVLVFRQQSLKPEAQLAFCRRLGVLDPAPAFDVERADLVGFPEIAVVLNIKQDGRFLGGLGDGELAWHSDMTYAPTPPVACVLHARELPAVGGDT